MGNPIDKYRQNATLEGAGAGSGYKSEGYAKPAMLIGAGAAGYADYKSTKNRQQEESEAADEIKREKRGVEKTSTDRARDDAREMKTQQQNEKASNEASKDMGFAKGGTASSRADGCCVKGKTRGKMM